MTTIRRRSVLAVGGAALAAPALAEAPARITLGYQTLWAAQGEIFEVLRRTNIPDLFGLRAEFRPFAFGPPLAEAAVAGDIDNIVAADVPVLRGAARIPGTRILSRTHDWRWAVVAQPDFQGDLRALRGRRLSGAFGTTVFPRAVETLVEAGLRDPFREITIINQDIAEQAAALQARQVDAVATWDPTLERLVRLGFRVLHRSRDGDSPAWLALTGRWLSRHGEEGAVRVLKAWTAAAWWASNNAEQARAWFSETSRIDADTLAAASRVDRYLRAPVLDIREYNFMITPDQVSASQRVVDFLVERRLLQARIEVAPLIDTALVDRAQAELARGFTPGAIRVGS